MEDAGWDPLDETAALFNDVSSLLDGQLNDYARVRLGLLLYSHLTEVDAMYEMLVNMVEISAGERYSLDPFHDLYQPASRPRYDQYPPSAKKVVLRVKERAADRGFPELVGVLDWFFDDAVRNAFFHSDYVLYGDEFRSRDGTFVTGDGVRTRSLKIQLIIDLIHAAATVYESFVDVHRNHREGYTADKRIRGRIGVGGREVDVTLLADEERGLYGFSA